MSSTLPEVLEKVRAAVSLGHLRQEMPLTIITYLMEAGGECPKNIVN